MENNSNRLVFSEGDRVFTFEMKLLKCRVPIYHCPTHEILCVEVTPNISKMCELKNVPCEPILNEVHSFAKELVAKEMGLQDDVFINVIKRQSTGRYIVLRCPRKTVENRLFDF